MWKAKGLWLRVILCWAFGCTLPFFDEVNQYDLRFRIRGNQDAARKIVLVYFDQEDWSAWHGPNNNLLRSLNSNDTAPLKMSSTGTDRIVSIGSIFVTNPETSKNRTIPTISNALPNFTSGTITAPATGAGTACFAADRPP